jgi:Protein of unknown function (DUF1566)
MQKSHFLGVLCAAVFIGITLPSQAALISVLGGQAFYDDQLDITWTANANINGLMNWAAADAWAAGLTLGGVSWRLPNMDVDNNGTVVDCSLVTQATCKDNEYGHLYYYGAGTTLGGGVTSASQDPFSNVQAERYWSSTDFDGDPTAAWRFNFSDGVQNGSFKTDTTLRYAWAVHTGMVPVPAAVWLFASGLLGLIGVARQRRLR